MKIEINGKSEEIPEKTILKEFIDSKLKDTKGVAVAINDVVIPKTQWSGKNLNPNDKILFIKATQGG